MSTKATATLHLSFDTEKQLNSLLKALTPEANAPPTHRSTVKLEKNGLTLLVSVEAEDTVALRATLNAYLHWINSTLKVIELLDENASAKY
jgi:tRNA threonylcarbamoyladenosine modification (KEOPS) complex  Pcc1 subunit